MGFVIVAFLVFGIGGWAATIPLEGAVVAQGSIVVDSNVKKVQHLIWRYSQRNSRPRRGPCQSRRYFGASR